MTTTVMRASQDQRARTKAEEGLRLKAYNDTVAVSTIGWGHASTNPNPVRGLLNGDFYEGRPKAGVTITLQEAERLYDLDISEIEAGISALVTQDLSQSQFDALVDFCFQYGLDKFRDSDLLAKLNFNPNNTDAIFFQFMRWTRAGGDHQEYVWRRSARRCCIYNGSPIPQALWRKNGFPFAVTRDDKVDYSITPSIEKIIAYGKKAAEKPAFPPPPLDLTAEARIDGEPAKAAPEPSAQDVAGGAPDALTSPPAAPPAPDTPPPSSGGEVRQPGPSPKDAADVSAPEVVPIAPPPVAPPPVIAGTNGTKPVHKETKTPDGVPYGIDPTVGAKPLETTERFIGAAMMWLANILRVATAQGLKFTGPLGLVGVAFLEMMKTPATAAVMLATFVAITLGAVWLFGFVLEKLGLRKKKKGEAKASQLMY